MLSFKRGDLIIHGEPGKKVNHRLMFTWIGPLPDDNPARPEGYYMAYTEPRLLAWFARREMMRDMGLVEDAFGFFSTAGHELFSLDERFPRYSLNVLGGDYEPDQYIHGIPRDVAGEEYQEQYGPPEGFVIGHALFNRRRHLPRLKQAFEPTHGTRRANAPRLKEQSTVRTDRTAIPQELRDENYADSKADIFAVGKQIAHEPSSDKSNRIHLSLSLKNLILRPKTTSDHSSVATGVEGGRAEDPVETSSQFGTHHAPIISVHNKDFAEYAKALAAKGGAPRVREPKVFVPSKMIQEEATGVTIQSSAEHEYQGDKRSKSYTAQHNGLPDMLNCSLFIKSLPRQVDEAMILAQIHEGAVFAVHINPADAQHRWSAAKVVFFKHTAALAFLERANSKLGIYIDNLKIQVIWNSHGYKDYPYPEKSRVLRIRGPTEWMNWEFWGKYFKACAKFQTSFVDIAESGNNDGQSVLEVGFARLDGQAETMHHAIMKEVALRGMFWVEYAPDPCDPDRIDFYTAKAAAAALQRQRRQFL